MKKVNILFLVLIGFALTFASCKKDDDDDGDGGTPTAKTCYVTKMTNENGSYTQVSYDADDHVVKTEEFDSLGAADGYSVFTYTSGNMTKMEDYDSGAIDSKLEITYNSENQPIKLDIFTDQGTGLTKVGYYEYTYSSSKLTKLSMFFEVLSQMKEIQKSEFEYSGDNVSKITNYEIGASLTLELSGTVEYTYDDKKNPFLNIGLDYFMGDIQFISKNNYTKMTTKDETGTTIDDESTNATYEYSAENYPTKSTTVAFDNSDTEISTYTYDCK
jgi:hypothetical protein